MCPIIGKDSTLNAFFVFPLVKHPSTPHAPWLAEDSSGHALPLALLGMGKVDSKMHKMLLSSLLTDRGWRPIREQYEPIRELKISIQPLLAETLLHAYRWIMDRGARNWAGPYCSRLYVRNVLVAIEDPRPVEGKHLISNVITSILSHTQSDTSSYY